MDESTQELIDKKAEELYPVKSMRDFIVCNNGTSHDAFVRGAQFAFETLSEKSSKVPEEKVIYYCRQGDPYCMSPKCRCNTVRPINI